MTELVPGNYRLEGHIDVPAGQQDAVRVTLNDHIQLTRAEPGCIFFHVEPDDDHPGRFLVSEAFVDKAAFEVHQARAGNSPWAKASADVSRHYRSWVVK